MATGPEEPNMEAVVAGGLPDVGLRGLDREPSIPRLVVGIATEAARPVGMRL